MESTYKIIGGDGREYGPVALEELKGWIRDGRVGAGTMVWSEESGTWGAASTLAELAVEFRLAPGPGRGAVEREVGGLGEGERGGGQEVELVGFGPRVGAYLVDWLAVNCVGLILPDNEGLRALGRGEAITPEQWQSALVYLLIGLFITAVYHVGLNGTFGATMGKMLIGARIVRMDGGRLGYGRAALRFVAETLSWLTLGIGFLLVGVRPDRRALHDLLAGTHVVRHR